MKTVNSPIASSTAPVWGYVAARLSFAALLLFTSIYCLLAYLPDTYYAFIQAPFQRWLTWLIRYHAYLYAALLVALSAILLWDRRERQARRLAIEFIVAQGVLGAFFLLTRPFSHLGNNSSSYLWGLMLLVPVLLLGVIDYAAHWEYVAQKDRGPARLEFPPLLIVAAAIGVVYPGMGFLRSLQLGASLPFTSIDFQAWLAAIGGHVLFAVCLLSLFNLAESVAHHLPNLRHLRFLLYNLLTWALLDRILQNVILATVPFYSLASQIYAATFALALVMIFGSLWIRVKQARLHIENSEQSATRRSLGVGLGLVLLASAYLVPALIGVVDWNFLLERLWALALWAGACTLVVVFCRVRSAKVYPIGALVTIIISSGLIFHFLFALPTVQASSATESAMESALGRHSYFDASFQAIRNLWTSPQGKPCDDLCQFLATQTSLPPTANVSGAEVDLVKQMSPMPGPKPNIFIIVVDSLRPDYLSAYNPAVQFTPEIGKFADDSTVMRNAFTRYAGTTLSEPAIWAGAMLLHKHYIQPFHPVNSLEKLVDMDGYQRFISVDTVLQVLLRPTPDLVRLDENVTNWTHEDFCATASDVESKITGLHDPRRPLFMFAQPQNIHGITLGHLGPERKPTKPYSGFNPWVASEMERLDGCFGGFVRYLKTTGLYRNSIIVLTSDHGDAYGEFGYRGHIAVHPSVLRVPLIIHLPPSMRRQYYNDPNQVAFNIDVTPSLYYLLGHRPIVNDETFGVPLFTATAQEASAYHRKQYLVVSSYESMYGLLGNDGRTLFVTNPDDGTNEYFDLTKDPGGVVNRINDELLVKNQELMRAYVQQIADFYHFHYHRPTFTDWLLN